MSNDDGDLENLNGRNETNNNQFTNEGLTIDESSDDEQTSTNTTNINQPSTSFQQSTSYQQSNVQVLDVEDLIDANGFNTHCDERFNCSKKQKRTCQQLIENYRENILDAVEAKENDLDVINATFYNKHQIFVHVVFLLTCILAMLIALQVCISKMISKGSTAPANGILIELQYLDIFLNHGLGIILFLQFGFNIEPLTAIFAKRKLKIALPKKLSYETQLICNNFKENHLHKAKSEIVFQLNERNDQFCYVFRGHSLVDWLLNQGLADNRKDAELYSKHLLEGRVIEHITNEQYFNDNTFLYKFN